MTTAAESRLWTLNNIVTAIIVPIMLFLVSEIWRNAEVIASLQEQMIEHQRTDVDVSRRIDVVRDTQVQVLGTLQTLRGLTESQDIKISALKEANDRMHAEADKRVDTCAEQLKSIERQIEALHPQAN